jgi:hypothetical protein
LLYEAAGNRENLYTEKLKEQMTVSKGVMKKRFHKYILGSGAESGDFGVSYRISVEN